MSRLEPCGHMSVYVTPTITACSKPGCSGKRAELGALLPAVAHHEFCPRCASTDVAPFDVEGDMFQGKTMRHCWKCGGVWELGK